MMPASIFGWLAGGRKGIPPPGGFGSTPIASVATMGELDLLFVAQFLLALLHAARSCCVATSCKVLAGALLVGAAIEQASIRLGGTHCHAPGLVDLSECSSVQSVLMYGPWLYASFRAACRLAPGWSSPVLMGALCFLQCATYELSGPLMGYWRWPDASGVVKEGATIAQAGVLGDDLRGLVAAPHALEALTDRIYGTPVMALFFHAALGVGTGVALQLIGDRWPFAAMFCAPVIALGCEVPVRLVKAAVGASTMVVVAPCVMAVAFFAAIFAGRPLRSPAPAVDPLLMAIPGVEVAYFTANALYGQGAAVLPANLKVVLCTVAAAAFFAFGRASGVLGKPACRDCIAVKSVDGKVKCVPVDCPEQFDRLCE